MVQQVDNQICSIPDKLKMVNHLQAPNSKMVLTKMFPVDDQFIWTTILLSFALVSHFFHVGIS